MFSACGANTSRQSSPNDTIKRKRVVAHPLQARLLVIDARCRYLNIGVVVLYGCKLVEVLLGDAMLLHEAHLVEHRALPIHGLEPKPAELGAIEECSALLLASEQLINLCLDALHPAGLLLRALDSANLDGEVLVFDTPLQHHL